MQQDAPAVAGSTVWSANRPLATRRAAVNREVSRLLDVLAPELPPPRHGNPVEEVRRHRAPDRCVLQGDARAVSVSWFPARPDESSFGEMQVIVWQGEVSIPGSARRADFAAKEVGTLLLHPVELELGGWEWRAEAGKEVFATEELAEYCRGLLQA